jgi:hypothetical protein
MTKRKTERHVIVVSTLLLMILVGLTLFVASIAQADPVPAARVVHAYPRTIHLKEDPCRPATAANREF